MRVQARVVWLIATGVLSSLAVAQGTKQWTVSQYDAMERGDIRGAAIRSDGRLESGPVTSLLYQTSGNYVWSVTTDKAGNTYAGMGGTSVGSAVVMKISADGKTQTKVFESKELGVQALRTAPDGRIYAATSPSGKVYRLGATPVDAAVVFDPSQTPANPPADGHNAAKPASAETPRYLWDLVFSPDAHSLYVAAGAPAVVYRVSMTGGKAEVAFRTADQHIRCLLMRPDGTLWAGTDGSGVIYRFDTHAKDARPIAAYSAARREITSLAADPAGNIYAAGVGTRPAAGGAQPGLPPLPVTGAVGVTITFSQPGSTSAAAANTLLPDGSEVYRIAPDGAPARLATLKEDIVYALAYDDGALLAATGNRGRIYRIDIAPRAEDAGSFTDIAHLEAGQATAFSAAPGGQVVGTSNSGRVYRLDDRPDPDATYTSEVFDAGVFSRWGRAEVETAPAESGSPATSRYDLFARTGNVENPAMGWSDWTTVAKDGAVSLPAGRFAQWKAVLHPGAAIDSVALNYLERNLAPVVDAMVVQTGARVAAATPAAASTTVQVSFPAPAAPSLPFTSDVNAQPLTAQKDRTGITARWAAHDDNGDDLLFAVWYRGAGEHTWRLLKDNITDRYLSFDAALLPDGPYEIKVVASDAPDHTDADTLTGERVSGQFVVDTTPPLPGPLSATLVAANAAAANSGAGRSVPRNDTAPSSSSPAGAIHAVFSAKDATSAIAHAEYSVDAGPWQYLEPVGKISDSLEEHYDFTAPLSDAGSAQASSATDTHEHTLAIRVYDRNDNMASVKAVVR